MQAAMPGLQDVEIGARGAFSSGKQFCQNIKSHFGVWFLVDRIILDNCKFLIGFITYASPGPLTNIASNLPWRGGVGCHETL